MLEQFSDLKGHTLQAVESTIDEVIFTLQNGDLQDLVGSPIMRAEESTSKEHPSGVDSSEYYGDSFTWYGESSGYYSESVD